MAKAKESARSAVVQRQSASLPPSQSQVQSQSASSSSSIDGDEARAANTLKKERPTPVRSGEGLGAAHAQAGYAKPSMWHAPQSLLYPSAPVPRYVSPERQATYFRRVAMPHRYEGPPPAPWQRRSQVMGGVFSAMAAVYMVFFHDFGPHEHVFTRLREIVGSEHLNPFKLSEDEVRWAARRADAEMRKDGESSSGTGRRMV